MSDNVIDIIGVGAPFGCRSEYSGGPRIAPRRGHYDILLETQERRFLVRDETLEEKYGNFGFNSAYQEMISQGYKPSESLRKTFERK